MLLPAFLLIIVIATLGIKYAESFKDGDVWFHLAYGKYFLANHTLIPDHTVFSWTPSDNSTIYCTWIPDISLYFLYYLGGLPALFSFRYLCFLLFILMVIQYAWKNQIIFHPLTWLICLTGLLMSQSAAFVKPEVFSFVFITILAWLWFTIRSGIDQKKGIFLCYLIPFLFLTWVNSHGGYIFGMIFLGILFLGEMLNAFSGEKFNPEIRKHFIISSFLSITTIFITPYGWKYPAYLVRSLLINTQETTQHFANIMAYQSIFYPDAKHLHLIDYGLASLIILCILLYPKIRSRKFDWTLILSNIFLLLLYAYYLRTTYFFAAVFTFSSLYLMASSGLPFHRNLYKQIINSGIVVVLLFFSIRANFEAICSPDFGFSSDYISPIKEAQYIQDHFKGLRLGNDYDCGAYLLWALWPDTKVFIDARSFPYQSWLQEYNEFLYGKDKTYKDRFVSSYNCDVWCLTYSFSQLSYFINSPDWRLVYYGPSACIFLSKRINFPAQSHEVSDSIYNVNFYQNDIISHFALSTGDLLVAERLVEKMKPLPVCRIQKELAANANIALGNSQIRNNKISDAIVSYRNALSINPGLYPVYNNIGNALLIANRIDEAIIQYSEALRIRPDYPEARKNLNITLVRKNKIEEAIEKQLLKLKKNPEDPETLKSLAMCYAMEARYEPALHCYLKELEIIPQKPETYYNIACLYANMGKIEESIKNLDIAIQKGFHDWSLLKKDPDLENIRDTDYYKMLMSNH